LATALPGMFEELRATYGTSNPAVAADAADGAPMTDAERSWGLAPPREYAAILSETFTKDYQPRFSARGVVIEV
jgi:hypothetical protein